MKNRILLPRTIPFAAIIYGPDSTNKTIETFSMSSVDY